MANALSKLAKKAPAAKSKSKTPVVEQESLAAPVAAWLDAKERADTAKADMAAAEQEFLPFAEEARLAESQAASDRVTSIRLATSEGKVLVVSSERFSPVTDEALPGLKKSFGARAKDFFKTATEAKVKDGLADEQIDAMVDALVAAGIDPLSVLDVQQRTQVTPAFLSETVTNPALAKKRQKAIADGDLKPYKAKVRK